MSLRPSIVIDNSKLIIKINASEYLNSHFLTRIEIMDIINSQRAISISRLEEIERLKESLLYYYESKFDSSLKDKYKNDIVDFNQISTYSVLNKLYLFYNILEYDYKYGVLNKEDYKQLFNHFKAAKPNLTLNDNILFNYYYLIILFNIGDYVKERTKCSDFLEYLNSEHIMRITKHNNFYEYLSLQIKILLWKTDKLLRNNQREFYTLSNEIIDKIGENYIKISSKILCSLVECSRYDITNFKECSNKLEVIYRKLKFELFYNSDGEVFNHKLNYINSNNDDTINLFMQILYRLMFCYLFMGDKVNSKRIFKKLTKIFSHLNEDKKVSENFKINYVTFCRLSNYILYHSTQKINDILDSINKYITKTNSIENFINFFALKQKEPIKSKYLCYLKDLRMKLQNRNVEETIKSYELINEIFSFYNYISYLSILVVSCSNKESQETRAKIKEIKGCSDFIIEYIIRLYDTNPNVPLIIELGYVKEVLMKICFALILSNYFLDKRTIEEYLRFSDTFIDKINGRNTLGYICIRKLKADELFRKRNYDAALEEYIEISKKIDEVCKLKGIVLYNISICYFLTNNIQTGKYYLKESFKLFNDLKKCTLTLDSTINFDKEFSYIGEIFYKLGP